MLRLLVQLFFSPVNESGEIYGDAAPSSEMMGLKNRLSLSGIDLMAAASVVPHTIAL